MANDIEVRIVLDDGTYKKGLIKAEDLAKKSGKKVGDNLESEISKRMAGSLRSLRNQILSVGAIFVTAFAGRRALAAAQEAEQATKDLTSALQSAGTFSIEMRDSITGLADEIERTTMVSADQFKGLVALAQGYTDSAESARDLAKASLDFAAGADITVTEAVRRLGRGVQGATGDIANFAPAIRGLTKDQLRAGEATKILAERFAGAAAEESKTFTGALVKMGNAFGKITEAVGNLVVKSPVVREIFLFLSEQAIKFAKSIEAFGKGGATLDNLILKIIDFSRAVNMFLVAPLELGVNVVKVAFNAVVLTVQSAIAGLAQAAAKVVGIFAPGSELTQTLSDFAESSTSVFNDMANQADEAGNKLFDFEFSNSTDEFLEEMQNRAQIAAQSSGEMANTVSNNFVRMAKTVDENARRIREAMKGTIVAGISRGIQNIATTLAKGGNIFEAFAGSVLGLFGDLAIQLGEFYIAQGIANLALKSVDPTGTIAAGAGLIALGSLMKSFFAAEGGGAGAGAGGGGGGVAGGGLTSPSDEFFETQDEIEERGPSIAVNIQGDVLDSRDSGLRIVDILNEAFETQGAVIRTV